MPDTLFVTALEPLKGSDGPLDVSVRALIRYEDILNIRCEVRRQKIRIQPLLNWECVLYMNYVSCI